MQRGTTIVIVLVVVASLFTVVTLAAWDSLRSAYQRRYLVLQATDVLWTDAPNGTIRADLGPHCPPALWAYSGALIVDSDLIPTDATGVLYVQYTTNRTFNTTGGGVAVFFFRGSAPTLGVVSAVDNRTDLFTLEDRNSTMVAGGTEHAPGHAWQAAYTVPVSAGSSTWHVTERYSVTSLGVIAVTVQPPQPCG
jgi:hypothetical protein